MEFTCTCNTDLVLYNQSCEFSKLQLGVRGTKELYNIKKCMIHVAQP